MPVIRCCLAEGYLRLYYLLSANTKRIISGTRDVSKQGKAFLVIRPLVFPDAVRSLVPFRFFKRVASWPPGRIFTERSSPLTKNCAEVGGGREMSKHAGPRRTFSVIPGHISRRPSVFSELFACEIAVPSGNMEYVGTQVGPRSQHSLA